MLKLSNENISRLYLGNTEIIKAYMGNDLVFSKAKTYTVTASIDPAGSGTVTGAGQYQEGAQVTLTATPAEGYTFRGWKEEAGASRLPAGYTELAYIESNGTQYIDTGVKPSETLRVDADVYAQNANNNNTNASFFGVYGKVGSTIMQFRGYISSAMGFNFAYGSNFYHMQDPYIAGRHTLSLDAYHKRAQYDSETTELSVPSGLPTSNIILFASDNNGTIGYNSTIYLYSCKIYNEDIPIRDFVPCKNAAGAVGLYDVVNGAFYANQGTGSFTAGTSDIVSESATYTFTVTGNRALTAVFAEIPQSRLPAGYTELEYVQSNGNQYVETGYKITSTSKVVMDVQPMAAGTADGKYFFDSGYFPSSGYKYAFRMGLTTSGIKAEMGRASSSSASGVIPYVTVSSSTALTRMTLMLDASTKTAAVDGTSKTFGNNTFTTSMTTLRLFGIQRQNTAAYRISARLYSCQVYTGAILERDFVPCINSAGTVGLYDLANDTFYGPATGTLTAGPAI